MKIEEIEDMWEVDKEYDTANLTGVITDIPLLHDKYYRLYIREGIMVYKMELELEKLEFLKLEYYRGDMEPSDLKKYGWEPQPLTILRADLPRYVSADDDVQKLKLKLALRREVVKYLNDIIKNIVNRGFHAKTILEFEKFKAGAY